MKFRSLKMIAAITAISAGVLFTLVNTASAATRVTVKPGDTISQLAETYNVSMQSIKDANLVKDINKIYVGEIFQIDNDDVKVVSKNTPEKETVSTPAPANNTKTVKDNTLAKQSAEVSTPAATTPAVATSSVTGNDAAAKSWIANRESTNNYGAQNGRYIGKYQLDASYLNGDYSPANQEMVADNYVASRYGSWSGAQSFWLANGWY